MMAGPGDGGAGPGADEDEALRLARAIAESKAQASKRVATIFAKSDLPDFQERPEVNWGERWELEEALATVPAKDGGAAAAAAMGMAHPEIEGSTLAGTGIAQTAIPEALPAAEIDPSERGFHVDDGATRDEETDEDVWVKTYDPNEDDFYFYNPKSRETTWDEPDQSTGATIMLHHSIENNPKARRKLGLDPPTDGDGDGDEDEEEENTAVQHAGDPREEGYREPKVYEYEHVSDVWDSKPILSEEEKRMEAELAARNAPKPMTKKEKRKAADEIQTRLWRLQDERQRREDEAAGVVTTAGTAGLWAAKAAEARAVANAAAANDDTTHTPAYTHAPVSEWALAAMEGLAAAEAGNGHVNAYQSGNTKEWYYRDDGGNWQGPWSVDELRGWRSMLPMELVIVRGTVPTEGTNAAPTEGKETSLAAVLGDDELLARAAAMDVRLPPRATATQAEIAINTVISMRAGGGVQGGGGVEGGNAGAHGTERAAGAGVAPAGMSAPPPPRDVNAGIGPAARATSGGTGVASSMVDAVLAGLPPEQYQAVVTGGVDPADMARALVAKVERDSIAAREAMAASNDPWASSGYEMEARYNKLTGRVTAGPAGSFAGGAGSIYAGGAIDHHIDVNRLEEGLWEMKRAKERRKAQALSRAEVDRLKKRKAEIKKKHYVAPWDVGFEKPRDQE